eukprot:gnl/TRDRNA2_/TRDRNA2_159027_c0_seq1.p1 gnl/TRDRNA2_/TRDRNA2_159027_c0~~gnl/TRDRNA2_/TRDRNA2_159027_c0_seq1.p1  ORF type:complete len:187 (-),score=36.55 gnl/TRDRNA2_/TRDRNA2_159027_c0_seq1:169-729(-)
MHLIAVVWSNFVQPLLFGAIGVSLDFSKISPEVIPKALLLLVVSGSFRVVAAYVAVLGAGLTHKERLFMALSWVPKATVQAALGSAPAIAVSQSDFGADQAKYERWATDIEVTAALSILFTAPLGCMLINKLGPLWLNNDFENCIYEIRGSVEADEAAAVVEEASPSSPAANHAKKQSLATDTTLA